MPEVFEDTLPMVVPMNRDYDEGRMDGQCNPLPDCTPGVYTLPNADYDDELVSASVSLPWSSNALWTMTIPDELRVWRLDPVLGWVLVENNPLLSVSVAVSGQTFQLKIEGLSPSGTTDNYLIVSAQKTDAGGIPQGTPITDKVKVEVVSIDLEIAEISELDEETRAASMLINDDYDEGNVHPHSGHAVADNNLLHWQICSAPRARIVADDDDLMEASLTIAGPVGQQGKYWIEIVGEPQFARYVLIWKSDGTIVPRTRETAQLITLNAQAVDILIEGLAKYDNESNPMWFVAHFEPDGDYAKAGVTADVVDEVMALVGVNKWTHDNWTGERGNYTGTATAGSNYDTLEQLAKNITGKAEDASELRQSPPPVTEPIETGTVVNVALLLDELENSLRDNVVEAANADKAAKFGSKDPEGHTCLGIGEKAINRIFSGGSSSGWKPTFDCIGMVAAEFARGVIMELMPGEFDALNLTPGLLSPKDGIYFKLYIPNPPLNSLEHGDYVYFKNNALYGKVDEGGPPDGGYSGEATIVITSGENGTYYGWNNNGGSTLTYEQWRKALLDAYNSGLPEDEKISIDDIPEYPDKGEAGFIDVAELAMKIFDYRITH